MLKKSIYFPIVFHFHQPVDNFEHVLEDCYQKSYEPLINTIYDYPNVKITLHFSGNLLEWFINKKTKLIKKIKELSRRGQIEIIGGGYYEPIFALIPTRDRIAQMRKLSHLIKEEFDLDVQGAWLSERVWEPNYPSFLNDVGLKYVILDDNHFRASGLTQEETLYTYITEDEGKTLRIFPINEPIRYLTPWKPTYNIVNYLKSMADKKGDRVALLISDAEKMGVWGSTHDFCYVEGKGHQDGDNGKPFMRALLEQIEKNDWIKTITLSEYMELHPARTLVYLPTASYDKMEEWALPTDIRVKFGVIKKRMDKYKTWKEAYQFFKGGFWRNFLVKYPEASNMHKKMLHVREKLLLVEAKIKKNHDSELISDVKPKVIEAWDEIYKGQCNDCYWHGLFGGVYLQFLRFSVYTHLINAEKLIDEINAQLVTQSSSYMWIDPIDFNRDSKLDVVIESNNLNLYLNPSEGGTIFELDYKPKSYNLLNTLTRWVEAYHEEEQIESGEVKIDRYRRSMLRLRVMHSDVTEDQIEADSYYEFGDFINGSFIVKKSDIEGKKATLVMDMEGSIKDPETDERNPCTITKTIIVEDNIVDITITGVLKELSGQEGMFNRIMTNLNVAIDIPFFFNGNPNDFQWTNKDLESIEIIEKDLLKSFHYRGINFKAHDKTYDLTFKVDFETHADKIQIICFPIIAYAYTDVGYKEIYQGINLVPLIKIEKTFELRLKLKIE